MTDSGRKTAFAAWREACDLDHEEAARFLGLTKQMVIYLDQGIAPRGNECVPQIDTRMLMTAAFKGIDLKPWPV